MDLGILPVKNLRDAKSRLAPDFSADDRVAIARALLDDALALCAATDRLTWFVVTDDDEVGSLAEAAGLGVTRDDGAGLNAALVSAIAKVSAVADSVTIVPVDIPLAWKGDLDDVLDTGATSDVVVVPSGRDGGTNALYLSPPDLIAPRFGEASLKHHLAEAERIGVRCSILSLPRLALDIDTVDDVDTLLRQRVPAPRRTVELLRALRA